MNVILLHSVPRSGSTWLQTLLDGYSFIKTLYQPLFSYSYKNKIAEHSTDEEIDAFCTELLHTTDSFCLRKSNFHTNNGMVAPPCFDKNDINTLVIKNVHHHYLIERLLQNKHKLIALIRDPRAVINSQLFASKETDTDWLYAKTKNANQRENYFGYYKWKEVVYLFDKLKQKYPTLVHIIKYEDLVTNFYTSVINLSQFLQFIDVQPMLNAQQQLSLKNDDYEYSVYRNNVDPQKWTETLPLKIIEYINNDIHNDPILARYY